MTRLSSRAGLAAALAVLGSISCSDTPVPTQSQNALPNQPSLQISDGAHAGNSHFFFLPPLVKAPTHTGQSDADQAPTVVVCEWNTENGGSCGAIIAQFGRGDGASPDHIVYDGVAEQYKVNWKTDQCAEGPCVLDPTKIYRLRVILGAYEIGHVDLDVVSSGSELKNVETGEYVGLVDGRTLPVKFRIEKGAVSVVPLGTPVSIGAEGGVLATDDGMVTLQFPPGALSEEKSITITSIVEELPGVGAWATPVDLGPDGTTFQDPVVLTLGFDGWKLPEGVTPSDMAIYVWQGDSWEEVSGSVVNAVDNTVSAPISHFSFYMVSFHRTIGGNTSPVTMYVNRGTVVTALATRHVAEPGTYCHSVRVRKRVLFFSRWVWETRCYTTTVEKSYPAVGQRVHWFLCNNPVGPTEPCNWLSPNGSSAVLLGAPFYSVAGTDGTAKSPVLAAVAPGKAFILAAILDDGQTGARSSASLEIVVLPPPVGSVTISDQFVFVDRPGFTPPRTPVTLVLSTTAPSNVGYLYTYLWDASGQPLSIGDPLWVQSRWTSSNPNVARVELFSTFCKVPPDYTTHHVEICPATLRVIAMSPGTATITATTWGKSGTATITVQSTALGARLGPGTFAFTSLAHGMGFAYGINDAGLVVGDYGGNNIATVWTQAQGFRTIARLDGTTGCCSSFQDVNASGDAIGFSALTDGSAAIMFWSQATNMKVNLQGPGRPFGHGINDNGDVVLTDYTGFSTPYFRPKAGSYVRLSLPAPFVSGDANEINNNGVIVGAGFMSDGHWRAVVWPNAGAAPINLGTLGGAKSWAADVNDAGEVVGWSEKPDGTRHAFLWTPTGGIIDLNTWSNSCTGASEAFAINQAGIIVGKCGGRPVVWTGAEGMRELPLPTGSTTGEGRAINGKNEIVGSFNGFGGALWRFNPVATP